MKQSRKIKSFGSYMTFNPIFSNYQLLKFRHFFFKMGITIQILQDFCVIKQWILDLKMTSKPRWMQHLWLSSSWGVCVCISIEVAATLEWWRQERYPLHGWNYRNYGRQVSGFLCYLVHTEESSNSCHNFRRGKDVFFYMSRPVLLTESLLIPEQQVSAWQPWWWSLWWGRQKKLWG